MKCSRSSHYFLEPGSLPCELLYLLFSCQLATSMYPGCFSPLSPTLHLRDRRHTKCTSHRIRITTQHFAVPHKREKHMRNAQPLSTRLCCCTAPPRTPALLPNSPPSPSGRGPAGSGTRYLTALSPTFELLVCVCLTCVRVCVCVCVCLCVREGMSMDEGMAYEQGRLLGVQAHGG